MKERWAGVSPLGFMLRGGAAVLPCDFENYVSILDADLQNLAVFTFSGIKNLTVLYCSQVSVFFVSRYIRVLEIRLIVKLKKKKHTHTIQIIITEVDFDAHFCNFHTQWTTMYLNSKQYDFFGQQWQKR